MPQLSARCPYCFGKMRVSTLVCDECATEVRSRFTAPNFLALSADQQKFAMDFILASGSLKEMASKYGISYPTVRARLDRLIECLRAEKPAEEERRAAILDAVEEKKISTQEASGLLAQAGKGRGDEEEDASNGR